MTDAVMRSGLRRWSWIAVVAAVLGAVGGWAVASVLALGQLTSTATVLVTGQLSEGRVDSALTSNQYVNQRMSTYAGIATSDVVRSQAALRAGVDPEELAGTITAVNPLGTTLLDIGVQAPTPEAAQDRAAAVVGALTDRIVQVENPPGAPPRVALTTVSPPNLPEPPTAPPALLAVLSGALAGLALGVTVVVGLIGRSRQLAERRRLYESVYLEGLPARNGGRAPVPSPRPFQPARPPVRPPRPSGPPPYVREAPRTVSEHVAATPAAEDDGSFADLPTQATPIPDTSHDVPEATPSSPR